MRVVLLGHSGEHPHELWSTLGRGVEGTKLSDMADSSNDPSSVQERAEHIGYATFAILFAVLDIGFVIVRVAGLVALSGSPVLAAGLVLSSISPSVVFPMFTYPARLLKRREREPTGDVEMESGTVAVEPRT